MTIRARVNVNIGFTYRCYPNIDHGRVSKGVRRCIYLPVARFIHRCVSWCEIYLAIFLGSDFRGSYEVVASTIASLSSHSRPIRHIQWVVLVFSISCALKSNIEVLHAIWVNRSWLAAVASLSVRSWVFCYTAVIYVAKGISGQFVASVYCSGCCLSQPQAQGDLKDVELHV